MKVEWYDHREPEMGQQAAQDFVQIEGRMLPKGGMCIYVCCGMFCCLSVRLSVSSMVFVVNV